MNAHLLGQKLLIGFTMRVCREHVSIYATFPFGFDAGLWNILVLESDNCLSFY